jgi:hypothetical protein
MYFNGISEGTPTAAAVQKELDYQLSRVTDVKPDQLTYFVTSIEELRGQVDALKEIEEDFADIAVAAAERDWTAPQTLLYKQQSVLRLADLNGWWITDSTSGRNNDARRSYRDGRFNIIESLRRELDREIRDLFVLAD